VNLVDVVHPLLFGIQWMDPNWLLDQFGTQFFWVSLLIIFIPQSQDAISGLAYTELIAGRVNRAEEIARRYTAAATEETWWAYKNAALDFEGLKWIRERVHR
jgi:hypothetical protein